jgi:hypothetical protein
VLDLRGLPVADWIRQLFKEIRAVPIRAIFGGVLLDTLQTVAAGLAARSAYAIPAAAAGW